MFWEYQALDNALFVVSVAGWGLLVALLVAVPGLVGFTFNAYRYHRTESIGLYLSRFMPPTIFSMLVSLSRSLSLTTILISGAVSYGLIPATLSGWPLLVAVGGLVGSLGLFSLVRQLSYSLWRYTFMPREGSALLVEDYRVLSILTAVLLVPLSVSVLSVDSVPLVLGLTFCLAVLILLLRMWQAVRRLGKTYDDYFYIFLYLCTHELLPWVYVATIALLLSGEVLL